MLSTSDTIRMLVELLKGTGPLFDLSKASIVCVGEYLPEIPASCFSETGAIRL